MLHCRLQPSSVLPKVSAAVPETSEADAEEATDSEDAADVVVTGATEVEGSCAASAVESAADVSDAAAPGLLFSSAFSPEAGIPDG